LEAVESISEELEEDYTKEECSFICEEQEVQ
jgi:hypothetical protein